ncbi:MAG: UvrD-helicase domain-containing protein, partial [Anaerolineae bacterium]|nr:UvrD-helicase domain-containing protein [Anaerolineae bacterium]
MTLTHEQQAAVYTHDRHLIVTAGAGSGKTRVLVERFLALLEANPDWTLPSVVAITFTEKAAREMRDRVRRAIDARIAAAALENDDAALTRWLDHQAALSRARIGTIHALCAHILRSNPAEARRDPAFEMLDENEAAVVRDDAVEQALARLVHADHPAAALLAAYGVRTVRGVLARYAGRGGAQAVYDALDRPDEALLAEWETHRQAALESLMADVHADAALRDALNWIRPSDLPPGDKLSDVWALVHAQTDALLGTDPAAFVAAVDALAGGIRLNAGSAKNWGGKDQVDESKAVLRGIRDTVQAIQGALPSLSAERDAEAVAWLALWWDAIQAAADAYTRLKHGRNALDFDDLETLARNLLRQHPHVAARYAHEFRHVMVDEFQDTNHAQRDIVYALAGVGQPGSEGRLFVVGDPKQSIYAFRGADVSVFGAVRDDLIAQGGQELPLATSFRTHEVLVTMLNTIFERLLSPGSSPTARYEVDFGHPMAAARPSEPADIPAHACPLAVLAIPQPDIGPEAAPDERLSADDLRRWEAWTLAQHIHDLVRAGTPVWDRDLAHDDLPPGAFVPPFAAEAGRGAYRPVCYGDVAVLFQAMTRVPLYEDVFKAAGLPYVTVAGKGYFDRQEVWDLLYLLSALHNPNDDLALAVALRSPLFGLSDDALYALRRVTHENGDRVSLARALDFYVNVPSLAGDDAAACDFARGVLSELRGLAGRVSIADLLTRAVHLTGYQAALTGLADGARRRGNVEKLITLARDSGRVSLGAFDAYARDLAAREVREGEAAVEIEGAVVLMSVHASKGLEFPVVALADTSWDRTRQAGVFTLDPVLGAVCKLPTDDPASEIEQPFAWEWARTLAERRDRAER